MTVSIPDHLAKEIEQAILAGEYASAEEVIAEVLDGWKTRHEQRADELAWLRARILRARLDRSPDLTEQQLDDRMNAFFDAANKAADEAA